MLTAAVSTVAVGMASHPRGPRMQPLADGSLAGALGDDGAEAGVPGGRFEHLLAADREADPADTPLAHVGPALQPGDRGVEVPGRAPAECVRGALALLVAAHVQQQDAVPMADEHPRMVELADPRRERDHCRPVARRDIPGREIEPVGGRHGDRLVRRSEVRRPDVGAGPVGRVERDALREAGSCTPRRRRRARSGCAAGSGARPYGESATAWWPRRIPARARPARGGVRPSRRASPIRGSRPQPRGPRLRERARRPLLRAQLAPRLEFAHRRSSRPRAARAARGRRRDGRSSAFPAAARGTRRAAPGARAAAP